MEGVWHCVGVECRTAGKVRGSIDEYGSHEDNRLSADGDADATQIYLDSKLRKYRRYLATMQAQGIIYKPIVWTAWGRAHPDAVSTLRSLAMKAARRRGLVSAGQLLSATQLEIALELQARAARMLVLCHRAAEEGADDDGAA